MKDRIFQIMKQEGLNQKDFAAMTGISPATLSSIFNGRTSPTLNHAEALHRRFPKLSMPWLMFGEGDMYVRDDEGEKKETAKEHAGEADLFAGEGASDTLQAGGYSTLPYDGDGAPPRIPVIREVVKYVDKPQRKITEIRIFFDDGTFETFPGR